MRISVAISAFIIGFSASISAAEEPPGPQHDFYQKEIVRQNACTVAELKKLKVSINTIANERQPDVAWRLSKEFLCGVTKESERYVRRHMPEKILNESNTESDNGSSENSLVSPESIELIRMQAWGVEVDAENEFIRINYYNSVCAGGFYIEHKGKNWLITAVEIYCD